MAGALQDAGNGCPQIDHGATPFQEGAALRVHDGATTGGQHQTLFRRQVANDIGLTLAKTGLAFDFENQRNSRASARFDFMVSIDKALVQLFSQCAPYRGFA